MVNISAGRMWTVTDAKPKLNALVAEAQRGQMTHIVSGAQVVAHLVPASTWILDDQMVLDFMVRAVVDREAAWAPADESQYQDGRFELAHAGDVLGRVLGWAWRTDADAIFMRAVTDYAGSLGAAIGRPLDFPDIRTGLAVSLGGGALERSEIVTALSYAETHWQQWALPASGAREPVSRQNVTVTK